MVADLGMYQEFPLPGAVGVGLQPWMRPDCDIVWEVGQLPARELYFVYMCCLHYLNESKQGHFLEILCMCVSIGCTTKFEVDIWL